MLPPKLEIKKQHAILIARFVNAVLTVAFKSHRYRKCRTSEIRMHEVSKDDAVSHVLTWIRNFIAESLLKRQRKNNVRQQWPGTGRRQ